MAANPERGEVDLDIAGTTYTLALGMGALRQIQAAVRVSGGRRTFKDVVEGASSGDVEDIVVLVWGALRRHHDDVTVDQVDDLIDALGGIRAFPRVLQTLNELLLYTAPDAVDQGQVKKTNGRADPPSAETAGMTGIPSTSRRGKSGSLRISSGA